MRVLTWILRVFLFLLLLGFALKNTAPVHLHFYFGTSWEIPLVVLILVFLAGGMLLGLLAVSGILFRQRREIARLRATESAPAPAPATPAPVDAPAATE